MKKETEDKLKQLEDDFYKISQEVIEYHRQHTNELLQSIHMAADAELSKVDELMKAVNDEIAKNPTNMSERLFWEKTYAALKTLKDNFERIRRIQHCK
jgi:hypothetical protein